MHSYSLTACHFTHGQPALVRISLRTKMPRPDLSSNEMSFYSQSSDFRSWPMLDGNLAPVIVKSNGGVIQ